jgi:DNA-binding response OmpR family regulator
MAGELNQAIVNRVLVIEDDKDEVEVLKSLLERKGIEVQVARDAGQARSAFAMREPDLVLLDLILPHDVSGFEVCERLKQVNEHIPVVILSAIELDDAKDLAERVGADCYLTKPYEPESLLQAMQDTAEKLWRRKHLSEDDLRAERVRFDCPECGKKLKVTGAHRGHRMNCPHCGASVTVPRRE